MILFDKNLNQLKQQKLPTEIITKSVDNLNPLYLIEIFDNIKLDNESITLEVKNYRSDLKENIKLKFSINSI